MRLEQQVKELEQTQPEKAAPVRAKLEQLQQEITKGAAATPADAPAAYVLVFFDFVMFFCFCSLLFCFIAVLGRPLHPLLPCQRKVF